MDKKDLVMGDLTVTFKEPLNKTGDTTKTRNFSTQLELGTGFEIPIKRKAFELALAYGVLKERSASFGFYFGNNMMFGVSSDRRLQPISYNHCDYLKIGGETDEEVWLISTELLTHLAIKEFCKNCEKEGFRFFKEVRPSDKIGGVKVELFGEYSLRMVATSPVRDTICFIDEGVSTWNTLRRDMDEDSEIRVSSVYKEHLEANPDTEISKVFVNYLEQETGKLIRAIDYLSSAKSDEPTTDEEEEEDEPTTNRESSFESDGPNRDWNVVFVASRTRAGGKDVVLNLDGFKNKRALPEIVKCSIEPINAPFARSAIDFQISYMSRGGKCELRTRELRYVPNCLDFDALPSMYLDILPERLDRVHLFILDDVYFLADIDELVYFLTVTMISLRDENDELIKTVKEDLAEDEKLTGVRTYFLGRTYDKMNTPRIVMFVITVGGKTFNLTTDQCMRDTSRIHPAFNAVEVDTVRNVIRLCLKNPSKA